MQSETYYKTHLEIASKENRRLKQRLDLLEKENRDLKRSIYELTLRQPAQRNSQWLNTILSETNDEAPPPPSDNQGFESLNMLDNAGHDESQRGTGGGTKGNVDQRNFQFKYDLKGHTGAVYCVQFSPCGNFLASGSFDKTARIWNLDSPNRERCCLSDHVLNISDLSWRTDGSILTTASFDKTLKDWDILSGKMIASFDVTGFALCVIQNPADSNIFFSSGTNKEILIFDRRVSSPPLSLQNDAMVNTLYCFRDGHLLMSGDSSGALRTWDIRMMTEQGQVTHASSKPISNIQVSPPSPTEEEGRFLAVNSYDNILRVYDRGSFDVGQRLHVVHSLQGYKNKNWPIRSSFFRGGLYPQDSHWQSVPDQTLGDIASRKMMHKEKSVHRTLLLATGSADPFAYIFDVGGPQGTGELVQRLEGHSERVYATHFHPTEPRLATASADMTVKIWTARAKSASSIMP